MKDKKKKSKLKKVMESRGTYIALAALIMAVGVIVYAQHVRKNAQKNLALFDEEAWQEAVSESGIEVIKAKDTVEPSVAVSPSPPVELPEVTVTELTDSETEEEKTEKEEEEKGEQTVETAAEQELFVMERPCNGAVIQECSLEELVFCEPMKDWRTHNGIDIAASEGDPVKVAADGVVADVYEDDLFGVVVAVEHQDGMVSFYKNLQSADFIRVGKAVKKGEVIGGVGKPGALESHMEPHLHFEVTVNGEYKNPVDYTNR